MISFKTFSKKKMYSVNDTIENGKRRKNNEKTNSTEGEKS